MLREGSNVSTEIPTPVAASRFQVAGVYATRWRYQKNNRESAEPAWVTPEGKAPVVGASMTPDDVGQQSQFFVGTRFEQFSVAFEDQLPRLSKPIVPKRHASIEI